MEPFRGHGDAGGIRRLRPIRIALPAVASAVVGLLLCWWPLLPAAAESVEFTITDSRITESSGLATDAGNQRYWTVNDSGDTGIAYALDADGDVDGTLQFRADPVDVEAVAFHNGRLYVADIGDNRERRDVVTVYVFDDAEPTGQPVVYKSYDFSYPDGPHDAETLLVNDQGRLFIVTKGAKGGIYAAPKSPARQGVNTLERVGDAPAYVTDGTVLPDGKLALRTYVSVEILDPETYEVTARAAAPAQKQGESITTTFDGDALLVGSEGKRSTVLRIDVPTTVAEVPSASAAPSSTTPPSPTATRSASPTTDRSPSATKKPTEGSASPAPDQDSGATGDLPDDSGTAGISRAGTLAAIGLAAVVAVVAAGVVILVRRP